MALYRCAACGSPNVITDTQSGGLKIAKKINRNADTLSKYVREYEAAIRAASVVLHAKQA